MQRRWLRRIGGGFERCLEGGFERFGECGGGVETSAFEGWWVRHGCAMAGCVGVRSQVANYKCFPFGGLRV